MRVQSYAERHVRLCCGVDTAGANVARDNTGNGARMREREIRGTGGQKDLVVRATRTSVLQIVQEAFTYRHG